METTDLAQRYAEVAERWVSQIGGDGGATRFVEDERFRNAVVKIIRADRELLDLLDDSFALRGTMKTADTRLQTYREVEALTDVARATLDRETVALLKIALPTLNG